ncbi:MAG: HD domain-containing phosphohydrolase [Candidatus Omnitrophota bacterium]|nr:HD domain-containing protein [Candidatus Omnitrophota bacterium]MBU3929936.1 HD domain-containing protein [bacterium]MBU4122660.1 HD domain-containing protein [bacterium]
MKKTELSSLSSSEAKVIPTAAPIDPNRFNELLKVIEGLHEYNVLTYTVNRDQELYDLIVKKATDIMNTHIGSLMLFDDKAMKLTIVAARGLPQKVIKTSSLKPGEGIAGKVFQSRKPIFCEDIEADERFKKKSRVKYSSKSFVAVPLKVKGRVVGVLNVNNRKTREPFTAEGMKILTLIADEAAMTIENRRLLRSIEKAYMDTIATLAKMLDERMPSTRGHSRRVAELSSELAKRMGLPEERHQLIKRAALIHDIGKIGIQDNVLLKPRALNAVERKIIQSHPRIGSEIVDRVEFFNIFVPIIAFHHEWFNGEGYPMGLSGAQIPLGARIVAVCDAWDAMISERAYRDPLTKPQAAAELTRASGSQFDPDVVKEFLKMLKKKTRKMPTLSFYE